VWKNCLPCSVGQINSETRGLRKVDHRFVSVIRAMPARMHTVRGQSPTRF
jgi:hypothetical protein